MNLLLKDGVLLLFETAFSPAEADHYYERLTRELDWRQEHMRIMGRTVAVPRLTAWYGDRAYRYSGIDHAPNALPPILAELRSRAEALASARFDGVLANLYRDGRDGMGWHADDEPELGAEPVIASLSFGATRRFAVKHKSDRELHLTLELDHGSCLIMAGTMQKNWLHRLAKTRKPVGARVNLTFRSMGISKNSGFG